MKNIVRLLLAFFLLPTLNSVWAQSVAFDKQSHRYLNQITVNGNQLLTGCGFYFIGSLDNVDNTGNITTCEARNAVPRIYPNGQLIDGTNSGTYMSPINGSATPWLAHQLHFVLDGNNSTRMLFGGQIGTSSYNFATVSMPLDARKDKFSHFRFSGSPLYSYAANTTYAYNIAEGPVSIFQAGTSFPWGEMIGQDHTVRVTITGTSPDPYTNQPRLLRLYFVNHPVTNNIEFSFDPSSAPPSNIHVKVGEKVNVTGHIEVFDTDPSIFGLYRQYETEYSNAHQIGRADGDGWSVNVFNDSPGYFMNYGPYATFTPGAHTAVFRFLIDNVTADNNNILYIDVWDATTNTYLASRNIFREEFKVPGKYQNFNLGFTAQANHQLEFRTIWRGGSYVKQDKVVIK